MDVLSGGLRMFFMVRSPLPKFMSALINAYIGHASAVRKEMARHSGRGSSLPID